MGFCGLEKTELTCRKVRLFPQCPSPYDIQCRHVSTLREQALAAYPEFIEKLLWGGKVAGIRMVLDAAPSARAKSIVSQAWERTHRRHCSMSDSGKARSCRRKLVRRRLGRAGATETTHGQAGGPKRIRGPWGLLALLIHKEKGSCVNARHSTAAGPSGGRRSRAIRMPRKTNACLISALP